VANDAKDARNQDVKPQPSKSTTTGLNLAAELNMASGPTAWDVSERRGSESDANLKSKHCVTVSDMDMSLSK
jgi:hypothetical protein